MTNYKKWSYIKYVVDLLCLLNYSLGVMKTLLKFIGIYPRKPSLLFMHMVDTTHETWLEQLYRQRRIHDYRLKS